MTVNQVGEDKVNFTLKLLNVSGGIDSVDNDAIEVDLYETEISGEAVLNGKVYTFSSNGTSGYIEFFVGGAWVVITDAENKDIDCNAYLFDDLQ